MATPEKMAAAMKDHSLADIICDIGYTFMASVEECKNNMLNFGAREPTAVDVAKTISMMIKYRASSQDGLRLQTPGNFWQTHGKDATPQGMGKWNADVFIQALKELVPNLNWKEVILQLDHQDFIVPDREALNLLFSILRLGLESAGYPANMFPVEYLCRRWTNLEGQISLIGNILKHPDIFSFADHPFHRVAIDLLKPIPETDKVVGTWRSLYLVELLLYASEHGYYVQVIELFKMPLQHCPDVLLLVLIQIDPPLTPVRQELLTALIPIFLVNHPNSGMILHRTWHTQNLNLKSIIMHAMADWYLRGECDQSRLSRILDVAQELKALSLLLKMQSFPFTIDLACLASRRKYLKLDKWLMDQIRENKETFVAALVKFLQMRYPIVLANRRYEEQPPKIALLSHENIATMIECLYICIPNMQKELQEAIYKVVSDCQALMPRETQPTRVHQTLYNATGSGATDPISALMPNFANISLNAPGNAMYSIPDNLGPLLTAPGSPSRPIGAGTNSPFATMPIHHNQNVVNIPIPTGMTPVPTMEKSLIQNPRIHYPESVHNVAKDVEDEANRYFQRIYNHSAHPNLSINEVLDMLQKFQDSPNKREREIFSYMLQNLFEEYKFFPQYPDKELHITAQLFGGIIEKGLVPSYVSFGLALRFVLEALKKGEGTKMYHFGLTALDRFKSRLKDYQKYCEHVKAIPYFNKFPAHLIEYVEYGLLSQEPPTKSHGSGQPVTISQMVNQSPVVTTMATFRSVVSTPSMSEMIAGSATGRPSIATVSNIDTLLSATDDNDKIAVPPEAIQDKTAFIFNNLSQLNLQPKCEELRKIITEEYFPWLSQYLVMKRVSIEFNFHMLYSNFLDVFKVREVNKMVTKETYRNIKVILRSGKEKENFTDRSLLKNLGHWLGILTLARNLPILHMDIDLKALLLEAYHRSREELLYIVPFVAKVLEACAKSTAFKPPNPWTMALMNVLAELHQEPNLELNLKFEVEVLCKNLSLDVKDLKPVTYLRDPKKVNMIKFQLSSQPIKQQKEIVEAAAAMTVNQTTPQKTQMAPQPKQMMRPEVLTPTDLVPNDPSLLAVGHPEPRFNYLEVNISSSAFEHHISFNPHILLFQNYPHLKQFVKPAIERSIQEWIHAVVDRAIKYAMTTCEQIIRKDFALDPDEMRMRMCAHHIMRNLTAGIAMVTCREQIIATISTNLKAAFTAALLPVTPPQDAIESAASVIANDNMELACTFIQKTAVEKALPELDKRLMKDYEIRKQAREGGCRYYDPLVLTYQSEMIPEPCRLRVGGPNETQLSVYEEFVWNIPGFAPVRDTALFATKPAQELPMPQQLTPNYSQMLSPAQAGADELGAVAAAAEMFLAGCSGNASKAALAKNMHSLLECLSFAHRNRDITSAYALLQKAVEGILDMPVPASNDLETTRYRDIHLRVLKLLDSPRMYGHLWTSKQVASCLADCREELRYNIEPVDCLIRNNLVNLPQYDITLARMMDNGNNHVAVAFAMQLVQLYLVEDRNSIVTKSDLQQTSQVLAKVVTHSTRIAPGGLLDVIRVNQDPIIADKATLVGPTTAQIHLGIIEVRSNTTYDDPPGLKQKTEIVLEEWRNVLAAPFTEVSLQQNFNLYVHRLNMNVILDSEELTTKFLRIATQICIENVYQRLSEDKINPPTPDRRQMYYSMCDSFTKLVSLLIKNTPDRNMVPKINLLNMTLGVIAGFLLRDHEERGTEFQQLPYHRLLMMLLLDMTVAEPAIDSISYQVLTAFCYTLHAARPARAAGFAYAWLEVVAHRVFIERVLAITPQQKGWGMYSTLLIDLFKFLDPFLRSTEIAAPVMALYKGTLKLLLVLLHDFPEFLCDYHYSFCDVIPPNCIQMRNLILSAFPRNMRLPDPFTPNLKVDLLSEITIPPRAVVNYATVLPDSQFKKDLDVYLRERTPVTFLSELRSNMQAVNEPGSQYNSQLINAVVLYVGTQAIAAICGAPSMATIAHSAHMDIFQNFAVGFDYEGRYIFLNAVANQLRYPNSHTHYFSCVLLHLFAEANTEAIQIQITRMLLERLIANRPHPWGLLVTFIELIKNPVYKFWEREFVHSIPEIENIDKLPPLYNYIVEQVIGKISGRKDLTSDVEKSSV